MKTGNENKNQTSLNSCELNSSKVRMEDVFTQMKEAQSTWFVISKEATTSAPFLARAFVT